MRNIAQTNTRSLLQLSLIANAFEWYEFSIYGFLSPTLGRLFFNTLDPTVSLLNAFLVLALGYIVRPLGGLFFGIRGDYIGRRYAMRLSLIMMAVPTIMIGLLPTYNQVGVVATIALVTLRIVQGFAVGGELPVIACYVFESARSRYKSLLYSAAAVGPVIGIILGSLTNVCLRAYFEPHVVTNWAWRLPFLCSLPLSLFIGYVREKVYETPAFLQLNKLSSANYSLPFIKTLASAFCLFTFFSVEGPILMIWMPFYLNHFLNVPVNTANFSHAIALLSLIVGYFLSGYISQKWGHTKLLVSSIFASLVLVIPIFKGLQLYSSFGMLCFLQILLALLVSSSNGLFVEVAGHLFKTESRCLGTSLAISIPAAFVAGMIPLVCTRVIHSTGWLLFPAYYIIIVGLIALPVALRINKLSKQ